MFQTNTSNFNSISSKFLSSPNNVDFPVIKFTRIKKEKPIYFGSLEKNLNSGKLTNNLSSYYSTSSYPDLVLTNSTNRNFLETKKNILLSSMNNKSKEEPFVGFFPKSKIRSTIKKIELESEKADKVDNRNEKNENSEKEKSLEKLNIKNLEFNGRDSRLKRNLNLNLNATHFTTFILPSNKLKNNNNSNNNNNFYINSSAPVNNNFNNFNSNISNNNDTNNNFYYNSTQHIQESFYSNNNNNNSNKNTNSCTYFNADNQPHNQHNQNYLNNNNNKISFGTNTNISSTQLNLNSEFKSDNSGVTSSIFGGDYKKNKFLKHLKIKNSPTSNNNNLITSNNNNLITSINNNLITSNNNFSKYQVNNSNNNNNFNNHTAQSEIDDMKNLKLRKTFNKSTIVFKSYNKFTKTNINFSNKRVLENTKVINMSDFDQFEDYKENYMKMREEQFLRETAYFIYDKFNKKKFKKFIFKEVPTTESFKDIINKITHLVEIKRNNNEFISVEYIVNMLREEIECKCIKPIRVKNEDLLLPIINKKSDHASLDFESSFDKNIKKLKLLKDSKHKLNRFNTLDKNNSKNNNNNKKNNRYFASCISEEVENYWENRNSRNDESRATNNIIKDGEKYIIKSKKKGGRKNKQGGKSKKQRKDANGNYCDCSSDYNNSNSSSEYDDSYSINHSDSDSNVYNKKQKRRRRKRRCSAGDRSNSENEINQSYMDQDLSELEKKRRRHRRRKDNYYAHLPKTSDFATKLLGNLEVNFEDEIKFLNTQKNFFMKRLDSFMITQSSGFDGLSDNMLRRTLSILDKYGSKTNKKNNKKNKKDRTSERGENDVLLESHRTDSLKIKSNELYQILNNNNKTNNSNTNENNDTSTNQNISPVNKNSNFKKGNLNIKKDWAAAISSASKIPLKSPVKSPSRKRFNIKDLKRKKSEEMDLNKINIKTNSNTIDNNNKNTETEGGINTLQSNGNLDLLNTEGRLNTGNKTNEDDLLKGANETEDQKTEDNPKQKKTRKRIVKKLKENCPEGEQEYEEVEIEETEQEEDVIDEFENTQAYKNSLKNVDVDEADINSFKKFMMDSLFTASPPVDNKDNEQKNQEEDALKNKTKRYDVYISFVIYIMIICYYFFCI